MANVESRLTVRFSAIGKENSNITQWSIESDYLKSTDGFEFEIYDPAFTSQYRLEMQPVELIVNGASQLIGRIDKTRVGNNGRAVMCYGRDFIADLVESNIDPKYVLRPKMNVGEMLQATCHPTGINRIIDIDDGSILMQEVRAGVRAKPRTGGGGRRRRRRRKSKGGKNRLLEDLKPKPGEGVYEFVNKLIARIGATIQPGPDRNTLVLSVPDYDQEPLYVLRRTDDPLGSTSNNVMESTADRDYSRMPTFALFSGAQVTGAADKAGDKPSSKGKAGEGKKGHPAKPLSTTRDIFDLAANSQELLEIIGGGPDGKGTTVSGRWLPGEVADQVRSEGRLYRLLHFRDDTARDGEQLERAADRAFCDRLKDSLNYECKVRGHIDERSGAIWTINTMVNVSDDLCNVHEELWIASRKLAYSEGSGATASLTCWRPDSFIIDGSLDDNNE